MSKFAKIWNRSRCAIYRTEERTAAHHAMARALHCDWTHWWAMLPFAPIEVDGSWWIAVSDTLDVDGDILLIDGASGAMRYADDANAVGFFAATIPTGDVQLYANGLAFARAWVDTRREIWRCLQAAGPAHRTPQMFDQIAMPGVAMIGEPKRIPSFAAITMADTITIDTPNLRQPLADAILRTAKLPTVRITKLALVANG